MIHGIPGARAEQLEALVRAHQPTLEAALAAVASRASWSPFKDSPSTKVHGPEKPQAGKAAFEARLGRRLNLGQPGQTGWAGEEVSPYTGEALGILYPVCDPEVLIAAGVAAMEGWRKADPGVRIAICLEIAERLYDRNFEMAHAVMHVAGQSYTQAFSGSGPNALDRGIEALAYAAKAMADVTREAVWRRMFGGEEVALQKHYALVPRGLGLVICCASFPTWNAYPAIFANLATGNAAVVKPHPIAVLPMAIVVEVSREVLVEFGFDPNLVALAVDTRAEPIAQRYIGHPAIQIVDFTGSPRFGSELERTVTGKLLFTETAGVNSVVLSAVEDLPRTAVAIARSTSLFSAQMCTSPQTIFIPRDGVETPAGRASFDEVAEVLTDAVEAIASNPKLAAGIMGAIQGEVSLDVIARLEGELTVRPGVRVLRHASPYPHPEFPNARTLTPLVVVVDRSCSDLYGEEQFGPVLFLVAVADADAAVAEATELARTRGAISSYLYATDEAFIARAVEAYEAAGANLSINLDGGMWINFAAAYSDYHVTGLNPAGNACLADLAFVANRFRIVQRRRPATAP